jgi:hypothetical protein
MTRVVVEPMPPEYAAIPRRWWPCHPPVFIGDGPPSEADLAEARLLFAELDPTSRLWYRSLGARLGLLIDDAGNLIASRGSNTP